jgi:hypothetical protein
MSTPFDEVIEAIRVAGYHNQRQEQHSDIVSRGIFRDLLERCRYIANDHATGVIKHRFNIRSPGDRERLVDLFIGEPNKAGTLPVEGARIVVEHKSVLTAHRNTPNRFDDLKKIVGAIHGAKAEAVTVATVLVGTASRVLNIADHVKKHFKRNPENFESEVLPRLSTGDETLWDEFDYAVSPNRPLDGAKTVAKFRTLPMRPPGQTHISGYDFVLIVPVFVDNVNAPRLCRDNSFGIDIDAEYERMLSVICRAYEARWHF